MGLKHAIEMYFRRVILSFIQKSLERGDEMVSENISAGEPSGKYLLPEIFLINLDSAEARLQYADAQLKKLGANYKRIAAVAGRDLPVQEKRKVASFFRSNCALGRDLSDGEIGCALSHSKVYRRMIDENLPVVCVLEDDVVLADSFVEQLIFAVENIRSDKPQVLLLSNHTAFRSERKEIVKSSGDWYTEGYVLNTKAAKLLLKANSPIVVPCDSWKRFVKYFHLELFHVFPSVCSQNQTNFASSIGHECLRSEKSALQNLLHKNKRRIERFIDRFLLVVYDRFRGEE